jgi:hypothetical protein
VYRAVDGQSAPACAHCPDSAEPGPALGADGRERPGARHGTKAEGSIRSAVGGIAGRARPGGVVHRPFLAGHQAAPANGPRRPRSRRAFVGQVLDALRRQTGLPWRVLNLSASGSLIRDVLDHQLPRLPASACLVTCGIGVNDVLYSGPGKLFADLRALLAAVPDDTVVLDLPVPAGYAGPLGWASRPYLARINRTLHEAAAARACRWPRCPLISCPPGPGSSRRTAFTPARTATATGPGPCWPSSEHVVPARYGCSGR